LIVGELAKPCGVHLCREKTEEEDLVGWKEGVKGVFEFTYHGRTSKSVKDPYGYNFTKKYAPDKKTKCSANKIESTTKCSAKVEIKVRIKEDGKEQLLARPIEGYTEHECKAPKDRHPGKKK